MLTVPPTTDLQLAIPVTLQKLVAITLVGTLVLQSYEAERVAVTDVTAKEAACTRRALGKIVKRRG